MIALAGSCLLVESPMYHLLSGNSTKATRSLEYIRNKNDLRSRQVDLYELHKRIRLGQYDKRKRSLCRYTFCTRNFVNVFILMGLQILSSVSMYLLWFEYQFI